MLVTVALINGTLCLLTKVYKRPKVHCVSERVLQSHMLLNRQVLQHYTSSVVLLQYDST